MSEQGFQDCVAIILQAEGGYVDNPLDNGQATNFGVTIGTLGQYQGHPATVDEVKALTPETVAPIYESLYWKPSGAALCLPGLDLMVFDTAVNMGVGRAVLLLQSAVGVKPDGAIGPLTTRAIQLSEAVPAIHAISTAREALYRSFATFPTFGRGWLNRLAKITDLAIQMANP